MTLTRRGLDLVAATRFEGQLEHLRARREVIESDAGLRERELRKLSVLSDAISLGFRQRGLDELSATLAAHVGVTVLSVAVDRWLDQEGERPLTEFLHETLGALRAVTAASSPSR